MKFRMTFEGEDPDGEAMKIRVCEPPQRLHLTSQAGEEVWLLKLDLTHAAGVTTLTFSQPGVTAEQVGSVGPGWDYYLDRLVDVETGADPALRDFDRDYYPATAAHYTASAAEPASGHVAAEERQEGRHADRGQDRQEVDGAVQRSMRWPALQPAGGDQAES